MSYKKGSKFGFSIFETDVIIDMSSPYFGTFCKVEIINTGYTNIRFYLN